MSSAQRLLDQVHSLAKLESVDPAAYGDAIASDIAPTWSTLADLETRDAALAAALGAIDAFCTRAMKIRLEHALASDTSIAAPTRNVFASTITAYADKLGILEQRARDVAARGGARDPDAAADAVVSAARAVLELREALRAPALDLARQLALAVVPEADRRARDRHLDDAQRKRWSAVRRDQEAVANEPRVVTAAPLATRIASLPEQLDEPAPEPERSFADMIELD